MKRYRSLKVKTSKQILNKILNIRNSDCCNLYDEIELHVVLYCVRKPLFVGFVPFTTCKLQVVGCLVVTHPAVTSIQSLFMEISIKSQCEVFVTGCRRGKWLNRAYVIAYFHQYS